MTINWANIASGWSSNFKKYSSDQVATIGSYDHGSVMHYSRCAASKNNRETITAKVNKWVRTWVHLQWLCIRSGVETWFEGFVNCFLIAPLDHLGSITAAVQRQRPVELSENILQNVFNKLPTKTVYCLKR